VRRLGSSDEWCICVVELVSPNKLSFGLTVEDGAIYPEHGGIVTGFLPVLVDGRNAYEISSMTPLEIDVWEPSPRL
jgi:hypothetical protein